MMTRSIPALALAIALLLGAHQCFASITIDFESVAGLTPMAYDAGWTVLPASRQSNQLLDQGVVFSSFANSYVAYVNLGVGHATSGARGIGGASATNILLNDHRNVLHA